jgi:hypothetical protein
MKLDYSVLKNVVQMGIVRVGKNVIKGNVVPLVHKVPVFKVNYVKMVLVLQDVELTLIVQLIKLVFLVNVKIHVLEIVLAVVMQFVKLLIIVLYVYVPMGIEENLQKNVLLLNVKQMTTVILVQYVTMALVKIHV